jgi:hypothetical protein
LGCEFSSSTAVWVPVVSVEVIWGEVENVLILW